MRPLSRAALHERLERLRLERLHLRLQDVLALKLGGRDWAQSLGAAIMFWPPPLFQAARANTQLQCENILKTKMKPFKSQAFESLMKRDPKQWAHWAQPLGAAIMDQVTSNGTSRTSHSRSCSW